MFAHKLPKSALEQSVGCVGHNLISQPYLFTLGYG